MRRHVKAPLWFVGLVAAVVVVCQWHAGAYAAPAPVVSLAFWQFLGILVGWIWQGLEAAGRVTLTLLATSVNLLWTFARATYNALRDFGSELVDGFRASWRFLRALYEDVLKPAWQKFWKFIEWTRDSLERIFKPIFKILYRIRAELLKFYDKWVRPVLDVIDVMRKTLRVFSALGLDWARKLDAKLGQIEEKIDAPFRLLLRKLNEVINLVDRVVTADGLFQRLALIRSLQRDLKYATILWWHGVSRPLTDDERRRQKEPLELRPVDEVVDVMRDYVRSGSGPDAALIDEAAADLALRLRAARLSGVGGR